MAKTTAGLFDSPKSPFHFLGPVVLKEIESHVKVFQLKKKQSVYQEGIKPSGLFYLRKGKVKISKSTDNGKEVILYIAKENDLLGYISLVCNVEYRSSAEPIEDSEVVFFPKKLFFDLIKSNPDLSLRMMQNFLREFDSTTDKLVDVVSKQVRRRVAEMLVTLREAHGFERDNKTLNISLSRSDLAHLVASNTETLVRILAEFKKEKIIVLKGKKIQITNPALLEHVISIS